MKKKILAFIFFIGVFTFSFGQIKLNGGVYSDSTYAKPLSRVKIIVKSENDSETYKTDRNGKFSIDKKFTGTKLSLEIMKKGFVSVFIDEITQNMTFDVVLKKRLSIHDKNYEGSSKVIIR